MASRTDPLDSTPDVVVLTTGGRPEWLVGLQGTSSIRLVETPFDEAELETSLERAAAVLVDGGLEAPLSLARRVRRVAPHLQVVLVSPANGRRSLSRTVLFTPGLGDPWVVGPREVDRELVERAHRVGSQRKEHARRLGRIARRVEQLEPERGRRAFLPDQYLATLLELLPEPVLALDEDDEILFANPVAESVFGLDGRETRGGRDLRTVLAPEDPAVLEDLLTRGREGVARVQVTLRTVADERRTYHAAVAPAGGEWPVRAVVLHDVTEQVEARQKLKEAMRHRSRFYANMSHELRTPLNAVLGYNDLLLSGVYGEVPPERRDVMEQIRRASGHLKDLVNDILDLSKVEAGKLELKPAEVDLVGLVEGLKATMEPLAREQGIVLQLRVERCDGSFRTDPQRLRQILMNLMSNAIQHGAGAPVDVRCRMEEDELVIDVEDRGPGIPADRTEDVFEEFVQLDDGEGEGTGLGLPIARTLARALGGEVTVTSEPDVGSVFRVRLPDLGK